MRIVGALLFVIASFGLAWSVREIDRRGRPGDVAFGAAAVVSVAAALLGLVLAFVPGFL